MYLWSQKTKAEDIIISYPQEITFHKVFTPNLNTVELYNSCPCPMPLWGYIRVRNCCLFSLDEVIWGAVANSSCVVLFAYSISCWWGRWLTWHQIFKARCTFCWLPTRIFAAEEFCDWFQTVCVCVYTYMCMCPYIFIVVLFYITRLTRLEFIDLGIHSIVSHSLGKVMPLLNVWKVPCKVWTM